jgi:hypothetical protein
MDEAQTLAPSRGFTSWAGNFYVAIEGEGFRRIVAPWCLSYHPPSPLSPEEVVALAKRRPRLHNARHCRYE